MNKSNPKNKWKFLMAVIAAIGMTSAQAAYDISFFGGSTFDGGTGVDLPGTAIQDLLDYGAYQSKQPNWVEQIPGTYGENSTPYYDGVPSIGGGNFGSNGKLQFWVDPYTYVRSTGNWVDEYGTYASFIFYAPKTGTYRFATGSDDASQLFVSTDTTHANLPAEPSAEETGCCNGFPTDFTSARTTEPMDLQAGDALLMVELMKEGGGGDYFEVGVSVDGGLFAPMNLGNVQRDVNSPMPVPTSVNSIVTAPQTIYVEEYGSGTIFVEFDFNGKATLQWQVNNGGTWTDIAGANGSSISFTNVSAGDSGAEYRVVYNGTATAPASLQVNPDVDPPVVKLVDHRGNPNGVRVFFTEPVNITDAENTANYTLSGKTITSATYIPEDNSVQVSGNFDFQLNQTYSLTVRNIRDRAYSPNTMETTVRSVTYAGGEPIVFNFNNGAGDLSLYGNAAVMATGSYDDSGYLSVHEAVGSQSSAAKLNQTYDVNKVKITFKAKVEPGDSTNPADGFSFNVANDLPNGVYPQAEEGYAGGEDPATYPQGLCVCFDNWVSGNMDNNVGIDIKYKGALQTFVALPKDGGNASVVDGLPTLVRGDRWFDVTIDLKADGTMTVIYDGYTLVDNLDIGWEGIVGAQVGFGGRTGGAWESYLVDDVSFNFAGGEIGNIYIVNQPVSKTVNERQEVALTLTTGGADTGLKAQWYKGGEAIVGATALTYKFSATPASVGEYYAIVQNDFSQATSDTVTVTVTPDTTAPTIAGFAASAALNRFTLTLNEAVSVASAQDLANYSLDGGLTITSATLSADGKVVTLVTSAQNEATKYTVTVNGLQDRAATPNTIAADSMASVFSYGVAVGNVMFEYWGNIGGTAVSALRADARYPDSPDSVHSAVGAFNSRNVAGFEGDGHDNYGARMSAVLTAPETGTYRLFMRSDDASEFWINASGDSFDDANLTLIMEQTACCNAMTVADGTLSALVDLTEGQRYALVGLVKEGGGGDYLTVGWRMPSEDIDVVPGDNAGIPGQYLSAIGPIIGEAVASGATPANNGRLSPDVANTVSLTIKDGQVDVVDPNAVVVTVAGQVVPHLVDAGGHRIPRLLHGECHG